MKKEDKEPTNSKQQNQVGEVAGGKEQEQDITPDDENRRDFLILTASSVAAVGAGSAIWPFISSMSPADNVLAKASIEVDLSGVERGQAITVKWRGKPIFIRNRTDEEVKEARSENLNKLVDPEPDEERVKPEHDNWLIMIGICTHLGCVPIGEKGDYNGWFCPCHGSHYDKSGRIRKGPAPTNLEIPPYEFIDEYKIKIG